MGKMIKNSLLNFLRKYKAKDVFLRNNPAYELLSYYVFNVLRRLIGYREIPYRKIVEHHYVKFFDEFKVEEDLVFLDCFWGRKIGGDPYAIYREMVKRKPNLRFIWVREKGVSVPDDVAGNPNVAYVRHDSKGYADALLKSKYLVCNSNFLPFFVKKFDQVFVNTWHGIPLKKLGLDIDQPARHSVNTQRNFNIADIVPVAGDYEFRHVLEAYGYSGIKNNVAYLGSPRIDLTLNADPVGVKKRLGVCADKGIILYAPTWRGSIVSVSSQVSDQIRAIELLESKFGTDYEIFVSLHHLTKKQLKGKRLKVRLLPDSLDINEVLKATDILVSDYSSIVIDFLVLDRPTVLYVPDYEEYRTERGLYVNLEHLPCSLAHSLDELEESCRKKKAPSSYEAYDSAITQFLPNEDGLASERVVDLVFGYSASKDENNSSTCKLLIYPGALKDSGITSAFKSLLSQLPKDVFDIYVLLDMRYERKISSFEKNFRYIQGLSKVIMVDRSGVKVSSEFFAGKKFLETPEELTGPEERILNRQFERQAQRSLADVTFDCVVDYSGYSHYWSRFIANVQSKRKFIYQHSDMKAEADNPKKGHKYLYNVFHNYSLFDYMASVSDSIRAVNLENLDRYYDSSKALSLPNLLDFDQIHERAKVPVGLLCSRIANLPSDTVMFTTLSRLSPEKNLKALVLAFYNVVKEVPNAVLVIVGDGVSKKELKVTASSLQIDDRVVFTGYLSNPYPILRRADCLVFPSLYEGQGLALLEAMSLGTYCIGSDIPAVREVLSGTGGLLVEPEPQLLADAMVEVATGEPRTISFDQDEYVRKAKGLLEKAFLQQGERL